MAHVHGRPDNEREWLEDLIGRGKGDPDVHGHYPGDPDEMDCDLCNPKVASQYTYIILGKINQSSSIQEN